MKMKKEKEKVDQKNRFLDIRLRDLLETTEKLDEELKIKKREESKRKAELEEKREIRKRKKVEEEKSRLIPKLIPIPKVTRSGRKSWAPIKHQ